MIPNPFMILAWIKDNWLLLAFFILMGFAGVQTYRLQGAQGELRLWEQKEQARKDAGAIQALHDFKNKERTDAQYRRDIATARAAGVRVGSQQPFIQPAAAGGSNNGSVCFDAKQLDTELRAWAERVAGRLTGVARQAEEVAAAYRACQAFVLSR